MSDKPLVSVIIPTYNQKEKFLRECIESAMMQTYQNIQIIISDNHSTNNAPQIIQEYADKDGRIKIIKPKVFLDISESFLFAITNAQGKFACYVSSDDILMPSCVEELVAGMLRNKEAIFAHGKAMYFYPDDTSEVRWEYFNGKEGYYTFNQEIAERLLKFEYVCFSGCIIDTEAWKQIMIRLEKTGLRINYSVDILVTLLLFEQGGLFYSQNVLAKVRMDNDTRESRLPYMIEDGANIWNFIEEDEGMKKMLSTTSIDVKTYRKRFFLLQSRSLYYPFFEKHFDYNGLKLGFQNLKKFGMKSPFYFSFYEKFVLNFTALSKSMYKIGRPLLIKIFKR